MDPAHLETLTHSAHKLIDIYDINEDHAKLGRLIQERSYGTTGFSKHKGDLMLHLDGEININQLLAALADQQ